MKKILALVLALVMLLPLCACSSGLATEETGEKVTATVESEKKTEQEKGEITYPKGFSAGFGRADITCEVPANIGPGTTATMIHDPLYATCVAICDGENVALFYHMDTKNIPLSFFKMATRRLTKEYGVPEENVILNATHSHNSPTSLTGNTRWLQTLLNGISAAAGDALRDLAPAEAYVSTGDTTGFGFVRRYLLANGTYDCNPSSSSNPVEHESEADNELRTIRFERGDKKDILLANWQCHAAHGRSDHKTWISSDFIDNLRKGVEKEMDVHFSYHNGASGNLNFTNKTGPQKANYEVAGKELVGVVKEAVKKEEKVNTGKIKTATSTVNVGVIQDTPERIQGAKEYNAASETDKPAVLAKYNISSSYVASAINARASYGPDEDIPLYAVSFGDIVFTTSPFEQFDSDGKAVRDASPFKMTFSCAYSNGHYGYLPSTLAYPHGSYEVNTTYFVQGTSDQIVAGQIALINQLSSAS